MSEELSIQWFPGHMAKTRRELTQKLKLVDAVCEVIDARIPVSSRNPEVTDLIGAKPRLIVLNRVDQASPVRTAEWTTHLRTGSAVLETDCKSGKGVSGFTGAVKSLLKDKIASDMKKGIKNRTVRIMIIGVPNVGKSSLINRVAGRKAAEAADRPGVTRGTQWINIGGGVELLDMPGLLWSKFDDKTVGENLAFTGAVKDDILDTEALSARLLDRLMKNGYCENIKARYGLEIPENATGADLLSELAKKRGFLLKGGELDTERMSRILLDEFRGGKLGRVTLERVP